MEIQEIHIHLLQISHLKGTIKASHWGPPFLKTFSWNEFHDSNRGIDRATTHVAFDLGEWAWNAQVFAWETSSNHPPNKKQTPGDVPGCFKVDPYNNGSLQSHVIPIYLDSNIPLYHLYSDDVPDLTCNFLVFLFGQTLLLFQSFNSTKNSLSLVPNFSVTSFFASPECNPEVETYQKTQGSFAWKGAMVKTENLPAKRCGKKAET